MAGKIQLHQTKILQLFTFSWIVVTIFFCCWSLIRDQIRWMRLGVLLAWSWPISIKSKRWLGFMYYSPNLLEFKLRLGIWERCLTRHIGQFGSDFFDYFFFLADWLNVKSIRSDDRQSSLARFDKKILLMRVTGWTSRILAKLLQSVAFHDGSDFLKMLVK